MTPEFEYSVVLSNGNTVRCFGKRDAERIARRNPGSEIRRKRLRERTPDRVHALPRWSVR